MSYVSCISADDSPLVLDASVIVSLNATKQAKAILTGLPNSCLVTSVVVGELRRGAACGHSDADRLDILMRDGAIQEVTLTDGMQSNYLSLVSGPSSESLDDGEAATLAYACADGLNAVIDERKALRICSERYPSLKTASTVDLLAKALNCAAMSRKSVAEAVFAALTHARMRVLPEQLSWVLDLIGAERTKKCLSIRSHFRAAL